MSTAKKGPQARKPLVPGLKAPLSQEAGAPDSVTPDSVTPDSVAKTAEPKPAVKSREEHEPKAPDAEVGGRGGLDPTRYGDWEINGRCVDF